MNFSFSGANDQSLTVSQINGYVKSLMDRDALLSEVAVRGEISNLKYYQSGHVYFTLKDTDSELSAVMFRANASRLSFQARNGMHVTAYGRISVYEKSGKYQLYVSAMNDGGLGAIYEQFRRLYEKLSAEGLFAPERKRPIPKIPKKIGIVTSPTGAAIRDMLNITGRRWPMADILVYPSRVQGAEAPAELRAGIEYLNADATCDVIIIGRGGGSAEDLWAFNDEALARTVAASAIPVISAVGHEVDFTLCDYASDLRAPTPSAAAELAVPDREQMLSRLDESLERTHRALSRSIERRRAALRDRARLIELRSPDSRLGAIRHRLTLCSERMDGVMDRRLERRRARLSSAAQRLDAMSPLAVLGRGYSALMSGEHVVARAAELSVGDEVRILMADGSASASISSVELRSDSKKR